MITDRYWQAKKVTLTGALINVLLGIIKLTGGILFHSNALVADGMHSFSDLITDFMVLFAAKYGSHEADDTHPYGHQRFETAATLLLALLLILAGFGIIFDALYEMIYQIPDKPSWQALPIAIFSILANEALFHYTKLAAQKIHSALLMANAWHHRSDAASSLVVALGLTGSLFGFAFFDSIAAITVGLMIVKMGLNYGWNSVKELVDTAVEEDVLLKIQEIIHRFDGVKKIHQLRSRLMGGDILIDVHILVSPEISVSEGHHIAQKVDHALVGQFKRVRDVIVHVDPEDDENTAPSLHLPDRKSMETWLLKPWQAEFPCLHHWTLHYLDGQIIIELVCDDKTIEFAKLIKKIREDIQEQKDIKEVRILRQIEKIPRVL